MTLGPPIAYEDQRERALLGHLGCLIVKTTRTLMKKQPEVAFPEPNFDVKLKSEV